MEHRPTESGLDEIGQISLRVGDIERATRFYSEVLGLRHLFSAPPKLAFFDCAGVRLMLAEPEQAAADTPESIIYYRVSNIQARYDDLVERGATPETEPHLVHRAESYELWLASLLDTEGNVVALMSEVSPASPLATD